jgi:hypothetical protein
VLEVGVGVVGVGVGVVGVGAGVIGPLLYASGGGEAELDVGDVVGVGAGVIVPATVSDVMGSDETLSGVGVGVVSVPSPFDVEVGDDVPEEPLWPLASVVTMLPTRFDAVGAVLDVGVGVDEPVVPVGAGVVVEVGVTTGRLPMSAAAVVRTDFSTFSTTVWVRVVEPDELK